MSTTAEAPAASNGTGSKPDAKSAKAQIDAALADLAGGIAKVPKVKGEMNNEIVESKPLVDALIRALISRTHLYVYGSGGVAKTFAVNVLSKHFDLSYLWLQFRPDMKREEVFGPLKMTRLQLDEYVHNGTGMLQDVELTNLDEFKDSGKFGRQLLPALNERWFTDGNGRITIPLMTAVGTTNFWIDETELEALFDRFAQRMEQTPVKTSTGFKKVLKGQIARNANEANGVNVDARLTVITRPELVAMQHAAAISRIDDGIVDRVDELRKAAEKEGLYASPRRWGEGVKLSQASAVMAGRDHVIDDDLRVFELVLLNHPDDAKTCKDLTKNFRDQLTAAAEEAAKGVKAIADLLDQEQANYAGGGDPNFEVLSNAQKLMRALKKKLEEIQAANPGRDYTELDKVRAGLKPYEAFMSRAVRGE